MECAECHVDRHVDDYKQPEVVRTDNAVEAPDLENSLIDSDHLNQFFDWCLPTFYDLGDIEPSDDPVPNMY